MNEIFSKKRIEEEAVAAALSGLPPTACRYRIGSEAANYWLEIYKQHAKVEEVEIA